uniref:Deacetylvindoline O-acetyltransferase-like n=1 Tax=Nicotiana sylvestris TaxID=4096 RepID=A0A1U7V7G4_NICSY|nr:PREDICTED: deacetylvindoline O-acetyltransferase-like [Nicotiana sylvestris]
MSQSQGSQPSSPATLSISGIRLRDSSYDPPTPSTYASDIHASDGDADDDEEVYPDIDERLEQSLCKLLTHIYPAAGRFAANDNSHSVDCLDQGVTYIKAKVNCLFDDFIKAELKDIDLALKFCPDMVRDASNSPLVVVQVTKFNCGGLALTISTSHSAMDGFTESKFLYEWAKVSKMGTSEKDINCFTFDLGTIFPASNHSSKILKSSSSSIRKPREIAMVEKRFVINESAISSLRDKLGFKPTRVEMAYLKQSYMEMFECDQDVLAFTCKYGVPLKSFL